MASSRFYKLEASRQKHILEISLEEFANKGFHQASINRISKQAGFSAGKLYYYFENKEDLYTTVVDHIFEMMNPPMTDPDKSFWESIEAGVRNRMALTLENKNMGLMLLRLFSTEYTASDDLVEQVMKQKVQAALRKIFNRGIQEGAIRQDLPEAFLFNMHLSLVMTTNHWMIQNLDDLRKDQALDSFIQKAMSMIRKAMAA